MSKKEFLIIFMTTKQPCVNLRSLHSSHYFLGPDLFQFCWCFKLLGDNIAIVEMSTWGQFHQRSTPSFYVRKLQLFLCLRFKFVLYWPKSVGAKGAHRTLVKLTPARQR